MKKTHSGTQGRHCEEATTRDQGIHLRERGEGQELCDTLKREGAVAPIHLEWQKESRMLLASSSQLVQSWFLQQNKEQRLAQRPHPRAQDPRGYPQEPNSTSFPTVSTCRTFQLASLMEKGHKRQIWFRVWHFCWGRSLPKDQPREMRTSAAATRRWPSRRHTSSLVLRQTRANTGIFSHGTQPMDNSGSHV